MITSTANQQMKNLAALQRKSRERKARGLFVAEGPRMCFEAPREWVQSIYVSESFLQDEKMQQQLKDFDYPYEVVADSVFCSVADTQTPKGIMTVVKIPTYELQDLLQQERTQLLILEGVQDPGNLGTMLRTGEGAGITGVIMDRTTVDLFNPKTIRSTMGSLYRVPYYIAEDLGATIEAVKAQGVRLYAAHLAGELSYDRPDYTGACGFLIGNEGNGLSDEIARMADTYIRIPMQGQVESLNAAMSAGILMYECNRQRRSR
ncbi:MAG: RNA methyltransferase [Lachnospiraceae bacterium]|nr:RNA methyltransferase [Lachnospiraceae bacterium]